MEWCYSIVGMIRSRYDTESRQGLSVATPSTVMVKRNISPVVSCAVR
jgi:hypothetical protein